MKGYVHVQAVTLKIALTKALMEKRGDRKYYLEEECTEIARESSGGFWRDLFRRPLAEEEVQIRKDELISAIMAKKAFPNWLSDPLSPLWYWAIKVSNEYHVFRMERINKLEELLALVEVGEDRILIDSEAAAMVKQYSIPILMEDN